MSASRVYVNLDIGLIVLSLFFNQKQRNCRMPQVTRFVKDLNHSTRSHTNISVAVDHPKCLTRRTDVSSEFFHYLAGYRSSHSLKRWRYWMHGTMSSKTSKVQRNANELRKFISIANSLSFSVAKAGDGFVSQRFLNHCDCMIWAPRRGWENYWRQHILCFTWCSGTNVDRRISSRKWGCQRSSKD